MITLRLVAASLVAIALAACGGTTQTTPLAAPTATAAPAVVTLGVGTTTSQSLPATNGARRA